MKIAKVHRIQSSVEHEKQQESTSAVDSTINIDLARRKKQRK